MSRSAKIRCFIAFQVACILLVITSLALFANAPKPAPSQVSPIPCESTGRQAIVSEVTASVDDEGNEAWTYSYECVEVTP